jgi:hypothetical protein
MHIALAEKSCYLMMKALATVAVMAPAHLAGRERNTAAAAGKEVGPV